MLRQTIAALLALFCWPALAAPWPLPAPDGPNAVGVRQFEIDTGARRLPALVWYPVKGKGGATRPYFDAEAAATQLPAIVRNMQLDPASMAGVTSARTHSVAGAAAARRRGGFPILIYSHGLTLWPAQNTALFEQLASHGYIIVSIAHPGDSVDIRLEDGSIITTASSPRDERFSKVVQQFTGGRTHDERTAALAEYRAAIAAAPLGASMVRWREDTIAVARLIASGGLPQSVRDVLAAGDRKRLGLIGMSFGGMTSASACRLIANCRAAVNLDGQNYDPDLFDRSVERPFLLMLSDWPRYRVFGGQPGDPGFTPNDYAYERWASAGRDRNVVRVQLKDITHLGYTDLVALMTGPKRDERVGAIAGDRALGAMNAAVLAFFNTHLAGGDRAAFDRALAAYPELKRHDPAQVREWAAAKASK